MAILTTNWQLLGQAYLGTDSYNHSLYIRTYSRYTEQDIANNRTYVQTQARTYFEGNYIIDQQGTYNLNSTDISGTSGICDRPTNGEVTLATIEGWIYHDGSTGTKFISASANLSFPNWGWNATASGNADLPTIPRASSIAVGNYDLGQNINVTIGKKNNSFTSTLTYKIGSRTGTIATKISDATYVWEMSASLISQIKVDNPSKKNVSATIYCETYNVNTKIGDTQSANFTLVITDKPIISDVVIDETIELIKQYTTSIVKYLSIPQFNIAATASEGTSISNYKVKVGDREITSSSDGLTINNIQYSYLVDDVRKTNFIVTVTDVRGNISDEYSIEMDFIEYVQLAFNNTDVTLTRLNGTSNYMKLHMTGYIYNGLIGETQNTLTLQYRYKLRNETSAVWSELKIIETILNDNNTFSIDDFQFEEEFDYRKNYDIEFYIQDLFLPNKYSTVIKTSETIVKVHKNGLDVKSLTIRGNDLYPIGSIYMSINDVNPSILFGGIWERIKGRFLLGAGDNGDGFNYAPNTIGGSPTHTLTINEMPNHIHGIHSGGSHQHGQQVSANAGTGGPGVREDYKRDATGLTAYPQGIPTEWGGAHSHGMDGAGGGQAHNNLPPYLAVYIWKRIS